MRREEEGGGWKLAEEGVRREAQGRRRRLAVGRRRHEA